MKVPNIRTVTPEELARQREIMAETAEHNAALPAPPII